MSEYPTVPVVGASNVSAPVGQDPTDPSYFYMRYPKLHDLLYRGGIEGVEYCLVAGHNLRRYGELKDNLGESWSPIRDLPPLTIEGPKGVAETVVLMGRGRPIPGSDDHNGVRPYYIDIDVEETTGMPANPESPLAIGNLPDGEKIQAASETKERAGAARGKQAPVVQVIEGK